MSEEVEREAEPEGDRTSSATEGAGSRRSWWIIGGISGVMLLTGVALLLFGGDDPASTAAPAGSSGLVAGGGSGSTTAAAEPGAESWSPFFVKGGFSLFLGFCVGYALRTFFKISAIVIGLMALCLFGLAKAGVVTVDWVSMDAYFDSFVDRVRTEAGEFRTFMTGSLPSAALAATGLVAGFRRRR